MSHKLTVMYAIGCRAYIGVMSLITPSQSAASLSYMSKWDLQALHTRSFGTFR